MTGKEILFKAMKREPTPRPGWLPFVGVHGAQLIDRSAKDYLHSSELIAEGLTKAYELYKPDGLPAAFDLQIEAEILGCELRWSDESPPSVTTHPLMNHSIEDLPSFDPSRGRFPQILTVLEKLRKRFSAELALYGLITGPFTLALHLMGNNIFLEMYEKEDHVKEVLDYCADVGKQAAEAYLQAGADVVAVVDPMTSQISPVHFETFVTNPINKVFDTIRKKRGYSSFFVCGNASPNLEVMARTHCDNISIDENIPLETLKNIGDQYQKSIGGNLKLTTVLLLGTPDDAKLDALRCMDICGSTGFILAPGCDIPWGTPPENLQAAAAMVHDEYQREIARRSLTERAKESYEDVPLPEYDDLNCVYVDIITLDSASCAPCQYMLEAAHQAAESIEGTVIVTERAIRTREGLGIMAKLGVKNIPTICIDGEARFISILPDRNVLTAAIQETFAAKKERQ